MQHPRRSALLSGETHYHGKPCRKCKSTLRYTLSADCVACSRKRATEVKRQEREDYLAAKAAKAAEVG